MAANFKHSKSDKLMEVILSEDGTKLKIPPEITPSLQCNYEPPMSSLSSLLKPKQWQVSFASTPDDIYWENLNVSRRFLTLKKIAMTIGLILITFFLTTPEYLVTQTDWIVTLFGKSLHLPAPIIDFLPTVMLWSFTALLPLLVAYSDRWLGLYTRSEENHR